MVRCATHKTLIASWDLGRCVDVIPRRSNTVSTCMYTPTF
jgi:hypothetical protein